MKVKAYKPDGTENGYVERSARRHYELIFKYNGKEVVLSTDYRHKLTDAGWLYNGFSYSGVNDTVVWCTGTTRIITKGTELIGSLDLNFSGWLKYNGVLYIWLDLRKQYDIINCLCVYDNMPWEMLRCADFMIDIETGKILNRTTENKVDVNQFMIDMARVCQLYYENGEFKQKDLNM